MRTLWNCSRNRRTGLRRFADGRRLRPYCASRRAASASLKPVADDEQPKNVFGGQCRPILAMIGEFIHSQKPLISGISSCLPTIGSLCAIRTAMRISYKTCRAVPQRIRSLNHQFMKDANVNVGPVQ